jgi:hypothetical protein
MKQPIKKKPPAKNALMAAPAMPEEDMQWKARDALGTLKRAHEIRNDPHLMAHVQKHAAVEKEALSKIVGRKKKA